MWCNCSTSDMKGTAHDWCLVWFEDPSGLWDESREEFNFDRTMIKRISRVRGIFCRQNRGNPRSGGYDTPLGQESNTDWHYTRGRELHHADVLHLFFSRKFKENFIFMLEYFIILLQVLNYLQGHMRTDYLYKMRYYD